MNFESMPNKQQNYPSDEGIELSPEELTGEPGDKVPGLQTQEALEGTTGSTLEQMQKFTNWEKEIESMSPKDVPEFIKMLGQEMKNDPLIGNYPELRLNYLEVRAKALQKSGVLALEILSHSGKKPIDSVLEDMKKAKDLKTELNKKYAYTKIKNDLSAIINAYQLQMTDPKILEAEKQKIARNLAEAKELKENSPALKGETIH